jgi:hypothetical protein
MKLDRRSTRSRRPVSSEEIRDREQRLPAVLSTVVELFREVWHRQLKPLDEVRVIADERELVPDDLALCLDAPLIEAFDAFASVLALKTDGDRTVGHRVWELPDAGECLRAEAVEPSRRDGLADELAAHDVCAPPVAGVQQRAQVLALVALVEDGVDLVE